MQMIPYLYSAFYSYYLRGTPPFRALVMDYPADRKTWAIDDEYLMGDRVLVAPVTAGSHRRDVYLPEGEWVDFWTGACHTGGAAITCEVPLEIVPMFVKAGSVLPLAVPSLHTDDPDSMLLDVRVYGDGGLPMTLYEDDGVTYDFERGIYNRLTLSWNPVAGQGVATRQGTAACPGYDVRRWQH